MYKREREGEFNAPVKIFKTDRWKYLRQKDRADDYLKNTVLPPSTITRNIPIGSWDTEIAQESVNICWTKNSESNGLSGT